MNNTVSTSIMEDKLNQYLVKINKTIDKLKYDIDNNWWVGQRDIYYKKMVEVDTLLAVKTDLEKVINKEEI